MLGIFLPVKDLSVSEERICSMELGIILCTFCVSQTIFKGGKKTCSSGVKGAKMIIIFHLEWLPTIKMHGVHLRLFHTHRPTYQGTTVSE